jgi:hypothetical protein
MMWHMITIGNQAIFDVQNYFRRFILGCQILRLKLPKIVEPLKIKLFSAVFPLGPSESQWAAEN